MREDPKRRGLLFAGTERPVYVSFDDGDHWQSLRLNMPATSIRDLVVKDDDLVVGTHGRGFWILDDITPLRQLDAGDARAAGAPVRARRPRWRVRWNKNTDTPLPPDEPGGAESAGRRGHRLPPAAAGGEPRRRSRFSTRPGRLVRRYSSDDPPEPPVEGRNIPDYWIRPPQRAVGDAGAPPLRRGTCASPPPDGRVVRLPDRGRRSATRRASRAGRGCCRARTRCG